MPKTASPDKVLSTSSHDDPNVEGNAPSSLSDGDGALNGTKIGVDTPRAARRETTPETNGHVHDSPNGHAHDDERPSKRRRTREATPPLSAKKPKPESPPWRKIEAEGPTSFTQNGRRKSGRINTLPLELQPQGTTRMTRRSLGARLATPVKPEPQVNGHSKKTANDSHKPTATPKPAPKSTPAKPASTPTSKTASKRPATETRASTRSSRRKSPSPHQPTRHSTRSRRSARISDVADVKTEKLKDSKLEPITRPPRIKLRVGRSGHIPLVHPDQVRKRPNLGTSFEDFWNRAGSIPVEEGGLLASEDGPPYTTEMAEKDAKIIIRIEDETEPGGLLSEGRCSMFLPEPEEEPPRQWAQHDHMIKAMANFRRLMLAEQQRHRSTAKKLAEACREEWLRRQPKSKEQIEAEAREMWLSRYRIVMRTLFGTWENVRMEVNRRRLEEWEQEEQKRVKAALNEAVHLSEQKLQARRAGLDSEQLSDDDGFDDLTDDASLGDLDDDLSLASNEEDGDDEDDGEEDSDNMSSDEDEADDDDDGQADHADEKLTQEQLRAKYANIPELDKVPIDTDTPVDTPADTLSNGPNREDSEMVETNVTEGPESSDESIDMDDDLGSSNMDSDGEDTASGDEEASEEESGDDAGGLLGLFFGKSELKKMNDEAAIQSPATNGDIEMRDADAGGTPTANIPNDADDTNDEDEVSLVKHPELVNSGPLQNGDANHEEAKGESRLEGQHQPLPLDVKNGLLDSAKPNDDPGTVLISEVTVTEANGRITTPTTLVDDNETASKPEASIQETNDAGHASVNKTEVASNPEPPTNGEDETMMGTDNQSSQIVEQTSAPPSMEQPQTAETDLVTNPPSTNDSLSPPPTSETRLSDFDNTSDIGMTLEKSQQSRSISPQSSRHKIEVPFLLRGTLREYQRDGLDWLAGLYANNTNGILADEMGLGKTIQTIALLAHLACQHGVWGPHLVVVPTSVMLNWEMEFKKWCPGFKILSYYGNQDERKRKRQGWNNDDVWNVCITSYQLVLQDQQVFKRRRWHYMILDEAHNIKNFKSQRWQTLLGFNTHSRLLLTGTPLQNNLTELWSLLFFLMPAENGVGGFADLQEFHDWFHKPESQILESGREQMDDEARAIISKLHKVLRPYLLRRLKADVEKQMPAKYEHVEFCRLSKRQRELYDGFLSRTDTKATLASGNYMSIINCLMQLRKVCNHPDLFVDRPIMTSFRMNKSVVSEFDMTERKIRSLVSERPMNIVDLGFLNLIPTKYEHLSTAKTDRISQLGSHRALMDLREKQRARAQRAYMKLDPATVESNIKYLESASRWGRFEELQHCVYLNALRRQQRPVYGKNLVDLLTIGTDKRPFKPRPKVPRQVMAWFEEESPVIQSMIPTIDQRADSYKTIIEKFSCVTPAVVTRDLEQVILGRNGVEAFTENDLRLSAPVRWAPFLPRESPPDPWHEARMRLSIQFPDKRLLQYDCGKLQALDKLLRKLQAGGHRALIFTQMTKVLDVLERFLNIHGHKYLRLDGATKVEQRQILTDRFNNDPRILSFILSTRSGGLGINLTGADTVIFYDQDWNPAMDKQCQDRCHRIGQTRDVHIYRLISEHTIEANILRKASQKQMLDDVVIQEGEFTTDHFNKVSVQDVLMDKLDSTSQGVDAADAALDRVLGGPSGKADQRTVGRVLEQAEDREDVAAARVAEKEIQADEADFTERPSNLPSGASTTRQGTPVSKSVLDGGLDDVADAQMEQEEEHNAWGERMRNVDDYMLRLMAEQLKGTKLELPKDKKKGKKKGKDTRKR